MGCCYSRVEREEMVSRCKARRRYMKQFVKARQALSASHTLYLRSLRGTGSALLQFATNETNLHHQRPLQHHLPPLVPSPQPLPPPPPPPPPPPLSSSSETWTSSTSPALPPPPPPPLSSWDFWDPFAPSSSRSVTEEEWEMTTSVSEAVTTTVAAASVAAPPSVVTTTESSKNTSELAMVVCRNTKDLVEIIKELDEYFLKAADGGGHVSLLLEVSSSRFSNQRPTGKVYNCGKSLSPLTWAWGSSSKSSSSFGRLGDEMNFNDFSGASVLSTSHCSTVDRLYAWEKKLFQEVKNAESIKIEHEKRVNQLRKQEMNGADYMKIEKNKKEIEKLESLMMVASQAMESTSAEIIRVREIELYPQLLDLVKGLMGMWRSMYECHQVQTHIVQQLKFLKTIPSTDPTSEIHRQSTLQLELEVQQWHLSFCDLIKAQQDYIRSLTGWLRLSLFQFNSEKTRQNSAIYSLCDEWQHALDRIPDKVASEGIKSFLTVIHGFVVQQAEEYKQKKRSEAAFKELEKKTVQLRSLECKFGPYGLPDHSSSRKLRNPVAEKKAKVAILKSKAEEERNKYENLVNVTRVKTLNNLQMGLPNMFQAMTGFSSVCITVFESVHNHSKNSDHPGQDIKRLQLERGN